eukprot:scaffold233745_cov35-Attheya_sp.AAC.1
MLASSFLPSAVSTNVRQSSHDRKMQRRREALPHRTAKNCFFVVDDDDDVATFLGDNEFVWFIVAFSGIASMKCLGHAALLMALHLYKLA